MTSTVFFSVTKPVRLFNIYIYQLSHFLSHFSTFYLSFSFYHMDFKQGIFSLFYFSLIINLFFSEPISFDTRQPDPVRLLFLDSYRLTYIFSQQSTNSSSTVPISSNENPGMSFSQHLNWFFIFIPKSYYFCSYFL